MTSEIVWVDKHYLWLVNGCLEHHWPIIAIASVHPNNPRNGCNERLYPSFWSRDRSFVELRLSWVFPYPTFLNTLWFNVIIIIAEAPRNIAFFTLKITKQKFVLMGRSKVVKKLICTDFISRINKNYTLERECESVWCHNWKQLLYSFFYSSVEKSCHLTGKNEVNMYFPAGQQF